MLREAIRETIACFPVYRTYIDERGNISERDRAYDFTRRSQQAKRREQQHVWNGVRVPARHPAAARRQRKAKRRFTTTASSCTLLLKFQQLTGPVMAKGLEDTACYVYNRFVSVNEVGGIAQEFRNRTR